MIDLTDANVKFIVKPYDPIEDAIQQLREFNATPEASREQSEVELITLLAHNVVTHGR